MGIEEGTFWDEHWVLYGNQFDNKLHILKKKKNFLDSIPLLDHHPFQVLLPQLLCHFFSYLFLITPNLQTLSQNMILENTV